MSYSEHAGYVLSQYPDAETFAQRVFTRLYQETQYVPCHPILVNWFVVVQELYDQNVPRSIPPEPPLDTLDHARWRDVCIKLSTPIDIDYMERYLVYVIIKFTNLLPASLCGPPEGEYSPKTEGQYLVPILDVLPDLAQIIEDALIFPFYREEVRSTNLFEDLRERYFQFSPKKDGKPIFATQYKGDPLDYIRATPFILLFQSEVRISIPEQQRFSGTWIVAPPGRGKTNLLLYMLEEDICDTDKSIILMDSKGDLIKEVRWLKHLHKELIFIDPEPDHPLALNPFDISPDRSVHAISLMTYIFGGLLDAQMTPLQSTLFRCSLRGALYRPNPTVKTFRDILANGVKDFAPLPPDLQDFFKSEFPTKTYSQTRQQIQWRLRLLMENPILNDMFSAPSTKLNLAQEMANGKVIIIDANKDKLGAEGSRFFQRFFIALVLSAAQQRSQLQDHQKRPTYFYIDECHTAIAEDENIATILDECRSQKIALILAHQRMAQITNDNVRGALANCAIRFANSDDDATALAPKLRYDAGKLRSLPVGTFACFIRDLGSFTLRVPQHALDTMPVMDEGEYTALKQNMLERYYYKREHTATPEQAPEHTTSETDDIDTKASKSW